MNRELAGDLRFFGAIVLFGMVFALLYDILRVWRRIHKQSLFFVSLQDFVFWFFAGVSCFRLMYQYNSGTLRLFVPVGAGLGALLYRETIGLIFVKLCMKLWCFVCSPIQKGLIFLKKQCRLVDKKQAEKQERGRMDAHGKKERKKKDRP